MAQAPHPSQQPHRRGDTITENDLCRFLKPLVWTPFCQILLACPFYIFHDPVNSSGSRFSTLAAVHAANALVRERSPGENAHPDSEPDQEFLSEIGKAGSWKLWQEIVTGKTPQAEASPKKSGLSLKTTPAEISADEDLPPPTKKPKSATTPSKAASLKEKPQTPEPATASAATKPATTNSLPPADEEEKSSKTGVIVALLALVAIAGVVLFLPDDAETEQPALTTHAESPETTELPPQPESPLEHLVDTISEANNSTMDGPKSLEALIADASKAHPVNEILESEEAIASTLPAPEEPALIPAAQAEQPATKAEAIDEFPRIVLGGIFYNPNTPAASINGKIVRAGAMVSGATIVRIEPKQVVISYNGENRSFALK